MKKGFTLIELLAVLVILVIIMAITTPIILGIIGDAKESTLVSETNLLLEAVNLYYQKEMLENDSDIIYGINIYEEIKMNGEKIGNQYENSTIQINESGDVQVALYEDGYCFRKDFGDNELQYGRIAQEKCLGSINPNNTVSLPSNPFKLAYEMLSGSDFQTKIEGEKALITKIIFSDEISEHYEVATIKYDFSNGQNNEVIGYIEGETLHIQANGKILGHTSMHNFFHDLTNLITIDFNGVLSTSNVIDMSHMFYGVTSLTELDLSMLDTANVTNMSAMFAHATSLTNLNLTSFNTSNVTDMSDMFAKVSSITSLHLTSFDTSKVTNMIGMFWNTNALTDLNLSSFNTSNVTEMTNMFARANALTVLDLSSFDTSSVIDTSGMFYNATSLTTGYAKTQTDADKFNSSSHKPTTANFIVKY